MQTRKFLFIDFDGVLHRALGLGDRIIARASLDELCEERGITRIDMDGNATVVVPGEFDEQRDYRQKYLDVVFKGGSPEETM